MMAEAAARGAPAGAAEVLAEPGVGALLDGAAGRAYLTQLAPGCVDAGPRTDTAFRAIVRTRAHGIMLCER